MGFPPPPNGIPPLPAVPSLPQAPALPTSITFSTPALNFIPPIPVIPTKIVIAVGTPPLSLAFCGLTLTLPQYGYAVGFKLPKIPDITKYIPIPFLSLTLSCDLSKPVSITTGVSFGGGRAPNFDADPDLDLGDVGVSGGFT